MIPIIVMLSHHDEQALVILYGSQTGNAEDLARRIGYMAKARGFPAVIVKPMDDYQFKRLIKERFILFVCSTTGHGQEPENMRLFLNFIRRRDLPQNCLLNLKFVVYGIGDSSYAKFNWVAKLLYKRLLQCGAEAQQELTLGDEQNTFGYDQNIYPKLTELWPKLDSLLGLHNNVGRPVDLAVDDILPPSSYVADIVTYPINVSQSICPFSYTMISQYNILEGHCIVNQRLTPEDHFQDTRLIVIKCDNIAFEPGDVCSIFPANFEENIQKFLQLLNLDANKRVKLSKRDVQFMENYLFDFIPKEESTTGCNIITIYDIVKYYFDIQSVPRRSFFQFLWHFSQNDIEKNKLKELSTTDGQEELYEYCIKPKRNILEVLIDFPHTVPNIKFDYLFDLIPPIKPRSFSIASSVRLHPNELHLIVGVVNYTTRLRKNRLGLCSNYLRRLSTIGDMRDRRVYFFVKKTGFKIVDDRKPIIMIGPGTGIAPFRSFLQDRSCTNHTSKNILYFGCRYRHKDFYFSDELSLYERSGLLSLNVTFSREGAKKYVQDLIMENRDEFLRLLLDEEANIYVAGNSKLPEDLRNTFTKMLEGLPESKKAIIDNPEDYVVKLELSNRIRYDCW